MGKDSRSHLIFEQSYWLTALFMRGRMRGCGTDWDVGAMGGLFTGVIPTPKGSPTHNPGCQPGGRVPTRWGRVPTRRSGEPVRRLQQKSLVNLNRMLPQQRPEFLSGRPGLVVLLLIYHIINQVLPGTNGVAEGPIALLPSVKSIKKMLFSDKSARRYFYILHQRSNSDGGRNMRHNMNMILYPIDPVHPAASLIQNSPYIFIQAGAIFGKQNRFPSFGAEDQLV